MTALTYPVRFCENDFSDAATITASGSVSGFSYTNASNALRSRVWKPAGSFIVTASKNLIYINDGGDKTITLTIGTYTYATLAAHIQTQLNASSSGWTCTYDSSSAYKFTIARSSSGTLRFTQTTAAAWDMLGYTLTADTAGTSFVAQEQRNHTAERYVWDFGVPMTPTAVFSIGPLASVFTPSENATITLKANNIDAWDSPAVTITLTRTDAGTFDFLDDQSSFDYRYWCYEIIDRTNPLGPEGLEIGRIWLGDYVTVTTSNVATGFSKATVDPSDTQISESGARYFNRRTKYREFSSLEIQNFEASERRTWEQLFHDIGIDQAFFVSLDPLLAVSSTIDEMTFYCHFADAPSLTHLITDYYQVNFELREAV